MARFYCTVLLLPCFLASAGPGTVGYDSCRADGSACSVDSASGPPPVITRATPHSSACGACRLPVCNYDPEQPRLYIQEMSDGAGHRMVNILKGMAIAIKNNMTFAGVLAWRRGNGVTEHKVDLRKVVNDFFGDSGAGLNLFVDEHLCNFAATPDHDLNKLEADRPSYRKKAAIRFYGPDSMRYPLNDYLTPAVQAALRRALEDRPLLFRPGHKSVAVHIRRGDLAKDNFRVIPDSYFLSLIGLVKETVKKKPFDIHIFTSVGATFERELAIYGIEHWKSDDFDSFRQTGAIVHLDEVGPVEAWAHFARADVLITSASYFSDLGAMLNPNCVLAYGSPPLQNGMTATGSGPEHQKRLRKCLKRR